MNEELRKKLQLYKLSTDANTVRSIDANIGINKISSNYGCNNVADIHNVMAGSVCENDNGTCFVIENRYPISYIHGGYPLGEVLNIEFSTLNKISKDMTNSIKQSDTKNLIGISDFLFLDTETTGLSGGVGTVAFLVGVGFFDEDDFVLRQYFMRDYDEEPALLTELNELLRTHPILVTFNGKAFDWNLLQTRFIFNRIKLFKSNPIHIDLLFPSRRIWKLKLESCRLQSIEKNILGEIRIDDIPGAQIPSIYFDYLQNRDAGLIKKVIRHNELDILSMVALLSKISELIDEPFKSSDGEQELLGIGKIFETSKEFKIASKDYDIVIKCFEECMRSSDAYVKSIAARRLSDLYKKSGDYSKAVLHWEEMLSSSKNTSLLPMIELAKYYEHREKDIIKALEIVENAIIVSTKTGIWNNTSYKDLLKRKERLKRKAGKNKCMMVQEQV